MTSTEYLKRVVNSFKSIHVRLCNVHGDPGNVGCFANEETS